MVIESLRTAGLENNCLSDSRLNSGALQPLTIMAYCSHLSKRNCWALRRMSECPDKVISLKRNPQCLVPKQA
ncbi:hypothetical protein TNCV_3800821 [Trichonephila clavipes]|nr:hypothetical protein TNCV_3800821 [Trichonephila clavipes]